MRIAQERFGRFEAHFRHVGGDGILGRGTNEGTPIAPQVELVNGWALCFTPTLEIWGRFYPQPWSQRLLWAYGEWYKVPGKDTVILAWKPLIPFLKAFNELDFWLAMKEYRVNLWYLGLMGADPVLLNGFTFKGLRKFTWLGLPDALRLK